MPEKPEELEETEVTTDFVATSGKTEEEESQEETKDSEAKKEEETPSEEAKPATENAVKDDKEQEEQQVAEEKKEEEQTEAKKRECSLDESDSDAATSATFALEQENAALKAELESLREFKLQIENEKKDALIAKYHMLSDEDKADIITHKEEYTLEQIDEKLALIYVRKNVDFSTVDGHQEEEADMDSILSFSLDDSKDAEVVSDIQAAFRSLEN